MKSLMEYTLDILEDPSINVPLTIGSEARQEIGKAIETGFRLEVPINEVKARIKEIINQRS